MYIYIFYILDFTGDLTVANQMYQSYGYGLNSSRQQEQETNFVTSMEQNGNLKYILYTCYTFVWLNLNVCSTTLYNLKFIFTLKV